ncbi:MAG: DUF1599 domain-containing protein [Cryomorphaceae bacterium]|nr:MAG: DUF1599 domain-containing protein [Cryomorphaceae bacterium]
MSNTSEQFREVVAECRSLFLQKMKDYGSAWRILRTSSLTDQLYIKANRIRTIQLKGKSKVQEGIRDEFIGIINYCVMAVIQLRVGESKPLKISPEEAETFYNVIIEDAHDLMQQKNHDYGEAWRSMRVSSITDLILMKLLRVKQIEDNDGKTIVSEGLEANYLDILNYAVFAMIMEAEEGR